MALEQVFVLTLMVMFAVVHGLARWRRGIGNSMSTSVPSDSDWETDAGAPDPFEPVVSEPPPVVETKPQKPEAPPRFDPKRPPAREHLAREHLAQQYPARATSEPPPRARSRWGAPPAGPRSIDAGLRDAGLIPQNDVELRRAIALVAIFGPPRALDPPE